MDGRKDLAKDFRAVEGILIALAVMGMENKGNIYFTVDQIRSWLNANPPLGLVNLSERHIKDCAKDLREKNSEINQILNNERKSLQKIQRIIYKKVGKEYTYRLSPKTAETPMAAKLMIRLEGCLSAGNPITSNDTDLIVGEIYEEFKSVPDYKLSDKTVVKKKIKTAIEGFYFTEDGDNNLYPTSRFDEEEKFLTFLMNREFPG